MNINKVEYYARDASDSHLVFFFVYLFLQHRYVFNIYYFEMLPDHLGLYPQWLIDEDISQGDPQWLHWGCSPRWSGNIYKIYKHVEPSNLTITNLDYGS